MPGLVVMSCIEPHCMDTPSWEVLPIFPGSEWTEQCGARLVIM